MSDHTATVVTPAMVVPIAAGAVMIDTIVSTRIQLDTHGAGALGAPLLGWLCEHLGPRATLLGAGAVTTLACLVIGASNCQDLWMGLVEVASADGSSRPAGKDLDPRGLVSVHGGDGDSSGVGGLEVC